MEETNCRLLIVTYFYHIRDRLPNRFSAMHTQKRAQLLAKSIF